MIANTVTSYLNPALEYLTLVFYSDAKAFFVLAKNIVCGVSISFMGVFSFAYLFIFLRFIGTLNDEIRQTREIVNMIPVRVLKENKVVREQVWSHKGIS